MRRAHDAFHGVAARAVEQERFLLVGAGDAHHPFGIGELAGKIFGRDELEIRDDRIFGDDLGRGGRRKIVADGADRERVVAGLQPVLREGVVARGVGGDADRDDRAVLMRGDDDAFHRAGFGPIGVGGDLAGECGRRSDRRRSRWTGAAWNSTAASAAMPSMEIDFIDRSLGIAFILTICAILRLGTLANKRNPVDASCVAVEAGLRTRSGEVRQRRVEQQAGEQDQAGVAIGS